MTQPTPEYQRQRRLPARLARCQTALERHQIEKGETLLQLARRLNLNHSTIYRLAGRGGSYSRYRDGSFSMDSLLIEIVSEDTGIPIGQLYEEAAMAARNRASK